MKKKKTYELFIFDFDGTLANSKLNIANSLNFALTIHGLEKVASEKIFPLIGKMSLDETFLFFYPELKKSTVTELLKDFRKYQKENIEKELVFFPEVLSTLQELSDQKKSLAILTTKHIDSISYILKVFNIERLFDVILGEGLITERKPARQCVEYVLSSVSINKSNAVMIGDSEVDVLTALNGGIDMIAVGHGTDSLDFLKEKGSTFSVNSFSEVLEFV
ncbi:MAG: HAD family hydrolase [Patescibacteria group bacterium]